MLQLLSTPPFYDDLTVKAGLNGVTVLKQYKYKKRYIGSKVFDVLPNGVLVKKENKKPSSEKLEEGKLLMITETKDTEQPETEKNFSIKKTEVRRRLLTFVESMPPENRELYFWTVTFPKGIADSVAYRIYNTWLTKLRQRKLLKNYLWIAERQKNGTIHFHIAVPHKMNVKVANREMMISLCTAARKKEINKSVYECKRYNGVDIAKDRFTRRVVNFAGQYKRKTLLRYLTKYVTKNNGTFTHLAWHNSRGFSALFTAVTFTVSEFVNKYKFKDLVQRHSVCSNEFFQFHPWLSDPPMKIVIELRKLNQHIFSNN